MKQVIILSFIMLATYASFAQTHPKLNSTAR